MIYWFFLTGYGSHCFIPCFTGASLLQTTPSKEEPVKGVVKQYERTMLSDDEPVMLQVKQYKPFPVLTNQ
jgi:hypothetical protein